MASVTFEPAAAEQFTKLPERIKSRMTGIIGRLQHWPEVSGSVARCGDLAGHFRSCARATIGFSFVLRARRSSSNALATVAASMSEGKANMIDLQRIEIEGKRFVLLEESLNTSVFARTPAKTRTLPRVTCRRCRIWTRTADFRLWISRGCRWPET